MLGIKLDFYRYTLNSIIKIDIVMLILYKLLLI